LNTYQIPRGFAQNSIGSVIGETVKRDEIDGGFKSHWGRFGWTPFKNLQTDEYTAASRILGATSNEIMRTLTMILILTLGPNTIGQQVIIVQPLKQSNSLWNPTNPNRDWVGYNGKPGQQKEAEAVPQWIGSAQSPLTLPFLG
jgi:hypothetical protein